MRNIAVLLLLLLATPASAEPGFSVADAFADLAPGADFYCPPTQVYSECVWKSPGITQPTEQQVTDWVAAKRAAVAGNDTRVQSYGAGVVANCNAASLALTADCVAFVEDKLKTMNAAQFASWYTTNVNTQAKAQTVLGLVTMVLAHQVRLN